MMPTTNKIMANKRYRAGMSLIETMLMLSITGGLMVATARVMHLATQVHADGIRAATHLRLVNSLEERLRSDIARALEVTTSHHELRLVQPSSVEVLYQLKDSSAIERRTIERKTVAGSANSESPVTNQRWQLSMQCDMNVELKSTEKGSLVQVNFRRTPSDKSWRTLREIEVVEVTHGE